MFAGLKARDAGNILWEILHIFVEFVNRASLTWTATDQSLLNIIKEGSNIAIVADLKDKTWTCWKGFNLEGTNSSICNSEEDILSVGLIVGEAKRQLMRLVWISVSNLSDVKESWNISQEYRDEKCYS